MNTHKTLVAFTIYRWQNPACLHDYPLIAVAEDRSVFMSLGDYGLCFDWRASAEVAEALAHDFAPTGDLLTCDFSTMRDVFSAVFAGGVRGGLIRFDTELQPRLLELSLHTQVMAEDGPEYLIQGIGNYRRFYREPVRVREVRLGERAMLDVCTSTFAELAAQYSTHFREPLPPRYRSSPPEQSINKREDDVGQNES